ncbi:hypothetical protein AAE478_002015 [Parahypoxylon ruwenzoriense]
MVILQKLTNNFHQGPYPAISPLRPEISQSGRTVLVTGGTEGIGYSIARAFALAGAHKVIILGRRAGATASAAASLQKEISKDGTATRAEVIGLQCDIASTAAVAQLWEQLASESTVVDVLVLNAAAVTPVQPILELGLETLWADFGMNVRAQLDMTDRFYKQEGKGVSETKGKQYLVHVSTLCIHDWTVETSRSYGLTKNAGALALQLVAQDTPPDRMQVLSFHPGAILTESARRAGYTEDSIAWDNAELPGHFAVWAASPEAAFLHGRFVWAAWDVNELKSGELRRRIDEDPFFLKIGVRGL